MEDVPVAPNMPNNPGLRFARAGRSAFADLVSVLDFPTGPCVGNASSGLCAFSRSVAGKYPAQRRTIGRYA